MKHAMTITVAAVCGLGTCRTATREAVNACRFEVSKKWNDVLDNACIQTWSPFYNNDDKNARFARQFKYMAISAVFCLLPRE
jgi:hypothetical protein